MLSQGEEHRLFWPSQAEFVRLAAQFNATIVPFGVVGEDDLLEVCSGTFPAVFQLLWFFVFLFFSWHFFLCFKSLISSKRKALTNIIGISWNAVLSFASKELGTKKNELNDHSYNTETFRITS
jgi:hypothetical protein